MTPMAWLATAVVWLLVAALGSHHALMGGMPSGGTTSASPSMAMADTYPLTSPGSAQKAVHWTDAMSNDIVTAQQQEIHQMTRWRAAWYGKAGMGNMGH